MLLRDLVFVHVVSSSDDNGVCCCSLFSASCLFVTWFVSWSYSQ